MQCVKCSQAIPDGSVFCPWCGKRQTPAPRSRKRRTSGSGSICKLSGKRAKPYLARLNGVTVGTFATVRDAERALSRLVDVDLTDKYNWTFAQVYEAWKPEHAALLESRAASTGSVTTGMKSYAGAFKHCEALHNKPMRHIRKADLQAILTEMTESGLSHSSVSKVRQLMSQLYQWAIGEHIVPANLAAVLVLPPVKKPEPQPFTPEEVRRIAACPYPAAAITLILLSTGCRIGELFKVPLEDCCDSYFIGGSKTAAGTRRVIPVSPLGLPAYQDLLAKARSRNRGRLIDGDPGAGRDSSNWRKRKYYPMLESLNISKEKTPHKTRHTYATAAVAAGVRPEDLTHLLGHASYTTTIDIYTHKSPDQLLQAAAQIDPSSPHRPPPSASDPAST